MGKRSVEIMVTFVISVEDERLVDPLLADLADRFDETEHLWFLNRVTQKDGRKNLLRLDYKRPSEV